MKESEIALIKRSWRVFRDIHPAVIGDAFYSKLFFDSPELRKMFPNNMEEQYQKLVDMLNAIIARLERIDELKEDMIAIVKEHEDCGVKPHHYDLVGKALLWTLQKGLGNEWTEEVRAAWVNCYTILLGTMIVVAENKVARL